MVQLWCTICISPFCDWSILSDLNMIPAAEKTCKRPPNWTRSVLNEYGPVEHPDRMSCKVECVTTYRYEWSFVVLQRCAGLQIIPSSRKRNMLVWCRPRQKSPCIYVKSSSLPPPREVVFHPCRFVGWFVGGLTQKVLKRFPWNLEGGWVSAQNRTH